MSEAGGVFLWTEDSDVVVGAAKGLHTLVSLLSVIENRCHAMEAKIGVGDEGWRRPLACLNTVMRFDVAVDCICQPLCSLRGDGMLGRKGRPSRTRKPMFDQSMVLTGGGGNAMARSCGKADSPSFDLGFNVYRA